MKDVTNFLTGFSVLFLFSFLLSWVGEFVLIMMDAKTSGDTQFFMRYIVTASIGFSFLVAVGFTIAASMYAGDWIHRKLFL